MPTEDKRALSTARRRRGVVRASITHLEGRVVDLESKRELTADDVRSAQHLLQKLNSLEADFKTYHLSVVDLLDEDALESEQVILDETDDQVVCLIIRLHRLTSSVPTTPPPPATESNHGRRLSRRSTHLDKELRMILLSVESISPGAEVDSCLLLQYEEQLSGLKTELTSLSHDLLSLDEDDSALRAAGTFKPSFL